MWAEDNWLGSSFELAIEIGVTRDDVRRAEAASALLNSPGARGPWRDRRQMQGRPDALELSPEHVTPGYGTLFVPGLGTLGCLFAVVREPGGADWIDLCVPTGMLSTVVQVNWPLIAETNPWMRRLDDALVAVGEFVFARVSFGLAVIGEEVSGSASASTLDRSDMGGSRVFLLSPSVAEGAGLGDLGTRLPSGLLRTPRLK